MLCPFCQQTVEYFDPASEGGQGLRCPLCHNEDVPRLYAMDYDQHPGVPFCIFGPTGHGKSVYIESLLTHLEQRIRWPEFSCQWMDQQGMLRSRERLRLLRQFSTLPELTNAVFPTPQVIRLRNVPQVGGCQLLFYDTGGETFNDRNLLMDAGRYLRHAKAVVWLVSPNELEYREQLSDLMTIYADAMVTMGGNTKDQTVIVALTKGDLLLSDPTLPQSARDFLENDTLDPAGDAWIRLAKVSQDLRTWLCTAGHANVVNLLRAQFKTSHFCILSAIGTAPDADNRLTFEPMPRGVLAPLFWLWRETLPVITVESNGARSPYFSLSHALESAPPGAVIHLEPQTYTLPRRAELIKPLRIIGRDPATTVIECEDERYVLGVGPVSGEVAISGVTIQHTGKSAADVIRVVRGGLALERCRIMGGVMGGRNIPGDGVLMMKESVARLSDCTLTRNEGNGSSLRDQAKAALRQCQLIKNGQSGLYAAGAAVDAQSCVMMENGHNGALLGGSGKCTLTNNTCVKNIRNGILATDNALVELRGNKCEENFGHGICCRTRAVVAAEGNGCFKNAQSGIVAQDFTTGQFHLSKCQANQFHGIALEGQANLTLTNNECLQNWKTGLLFSGTTAGKGEGNVCESNRIDGIQVSDAATPELNANAANNNGQFGFHVTTTGAHKLGLKNGAKGNKKAEVHPPSLFRKSWFG